ncbi:hypothetical protein [Fluviicola taffensis]|uniref:hypothetical protein n=1 Tax=Fluviicola taffensis TaxID=191579 RepID=UPI003137BA0E
METKRKTDLFRFATMRAPQLISKERRALGFVENGLINSSHFLQGLDPEDGLDVLRLVIQGRIATFSAYETVEQVKAINEPFWDFSLWLAENRNELVRDELDAKAASFLGINSSTRNKLWDQVYYDILTETNPYVRQACMQLLVADNFIWNYQTYSPNLPDADKEAEAKLLKRLANGKLIIHAAITRKKVAVLPGSRVNHLPALKQEEKIKAQVAALHADKKRVIEKELIALKAQYIKDYNAAFKTAQTAYQAVVKPIIADFLDDNPEIKNSPDREDLIPEHIIDPFTFTFNEPLSPIYASPKVSKETQDFISAQKLQESDIDGAIGLISQEKTALKRTAANVIQKQVSQVTVNGVQINATTGDSKEFAVLFDETIDENKYLVYVSVNSGVKGAYFKDAGFSIQQEGSAAKTFNSPCLKTSNDGSIFVLLSNEPVTLDPCKIFTFTGTFLLNNSESYTIEKKGNTNQRVISGRAYRALITDDETVIYGVNKIGVIDYRKVEQELCCYIPGEVSHIENIMAKEYKDRSTRSLLRVEQNTETTTEHEVETNTDTTSTTRDELSSEISKIIEKERSTDLGFNAQASGGSEKTYQWGVDASADFSFGQSSSNSNNIARTKAQELTQRALERVVHKVSSIRTSKMLREFEDSSAHGFDNRKGNSHITGVYRWVDKVYKNRIVNYGKRLIYEFMIPEPSRWYKEAIIVEKEESEANGNTGNGDNGLVPPKHPKENQIFNAESITRTNYTQLASLYGADIVAPMDQFKSVSESYAESVGDNKHHSYNSYTPITFPDGYVCTRIKGSVSGEYKSKSSPYASLVVGLSGAPSYTKNFGDGKGNYSGSFDYSGLNCTPSVKVTIGMQKVDSVNLSVECVCELSTERYKQWQQDAYAAIMEIYNQQLAQYNDAVTAAKNEQAAKDAAEKAENESVPSNSKFNAQIINTELKRLCIEMLTAPFGRVQGKDFYLPGECKVPKVAQSAALDAYASQVKFFEQAFDWSILSQMFYPYYWAKKCDWKELFQSQDSGDLNFQAFLQSGMARIMVPVREGFEDAVTFYMETGKIWNGTGLVVDTDDELYISIVEEMTDVKGFTEGDEWETVVPSDLTIIQAKSVFLEDEGLPCCHDNEDLPVNMKFQGTDKVLTAKDESDDPELIPLG